MGFVRRRRHRFQQIADLARRFVLVGDPGQIAPVVTCEIERWQADPAGPHIPCPRALTERFSVVKHSLPISRRLVPDTVKFIQPAFYPELEFSALSAPGERTLELNIAGTTRFDSPLKLMSRGTSMVLAEMPACVTGEFDEELAEAIVAMIQRLFHRNARLRDGKNVKSLLPSMVGVVCAHVAQVNAVRERLPQNLSDVFVETSDRFQGLERPIMFVHHPLSGRIDASEFHLDAGRLCVMLSRHNVACCIVARSGIDGQLRRYAPVGNRVLGPIQDEEYRGWRAHVTLIEHLANSDRIVQIG